MQDRVEVAMGRDHGGRLGKAEHSREKGGNGRKASQEEQKGGKGGGEDRWSQRARRKRSRTGGRSYGGSPTEHSLPGLWWGGG